MLSDQRGVPFTVANDEALAAFDRCIDAYLRFGRDTGVYLKAALQADPGMIMGHCLMGYFMHLMGSPSLLPRAQKALAAAQNKVAEASAREQTHVAALKAWCAGDLHAAARCWDTILLDHPRDALAIKLAQFLWFYLGESQQMRDSLARVLPAWDEGTPGYSYMLGSHAFGLEETGDYTGAERRGRRAVELEPNDPWSIHAVAHVLEMQDRHHEGVDWLDGLEGHWSACNNFRYHVYWHRLLYLLDRGRYDEVLARYDRELWDPESDEYLDLCNDAALLLRLEIAGIDVGQRWQALFEKVENRTDEHLLAFVDAHFTIALAAGGGEQAAQRLLDSIRARQPAPAGNTTGQVLANTGLVLCEALAAHRAGHYERTVELLEPIRYQIRQIGGSHAQRDLFAQVLLDAAIKADQLPLARALLAERTALKPNNPWSWRRYAEVLGRLHDPAADGVRARAEALLKQPM